MSEIVYPVTAATPWATSVIAADGLEICDCRTEGTASDGEARARRIAAALNATQGLSIDDLESLSPHAMAESRARCMGDIFGSGSAARGE